MQLGELLTVLTKADDTLVPRRSDLLRFRIDPAQPALVDGFRAIWPGLKYVHVRTGEPWEWRGKIVFGDTSTGRRRLLSFKIRLRGNILNEEQSAKVLIALALTEYNNTSGRFDADKLIGRLVRDVQAKWEKHVNGACARGFSTSQFAKTQRYFQTEFNSAGLNVDEPDFYPEAYDDAVPGRTDKILEFDDGGKPLTVRDPKVLGDRRIAYKARLRYARSEDALVGLYSYLGTIRGQEPGPPLDPPGEDGQVQPLELWFRRLLQEALAQEAWEDPAHPVISSEMKAALSAKLVRATGRELEEIIPLPAAGGDPPPASGRLAFDHSYSLVGLGKQDSLKVAHAVQYNVVNQDRWKAAGSPDVEPLLRSYAVNAMNGFLHGLEYGEVVSVYAAGVRDKRPLDAKLQAEVLAKAGAVGIEIRGPIASIIDLPGRDFVQGHPIRLDEAAYTMRGDFGVQTVFSADVEVMLDTTGPDHARRFAAAIQRSDDFELEVQSAIRRVIRDVLETEMYPAAFYNSLYMVRGERAAPTAQTDTAADDATALIRGRIQSRLLESFGLTVQRFDITRSLRDEVANRLHELINHNHIAHSFEDPVGLPPVQARASATFDLRVRTILMEGWVSFQSRVQRPFPDHVDEVKTAATAVIRRLFQEKLPDRPEELHEEIRNGRLARDILEEVGEECGLAVEIVGLKIAVTPPAVSQLPVRKLALLHEEHTAVSNLILSSAHDLSRDREEVFGRLAQIEADIEKAEAQVSTQARAQSTSSSSLNRRLRLLPNGTVDDGLSPRLAYRGADTSHQTTDQS